MEQISESVPSNTRSAEAPDLVDKIKPLHPTFIRGRALSRVCDNFLIEPMSPPGVYTGSLNWSLN